MPHTIEGSRARVLTCTAKMSLRHLRGSDGGAWKVKAFATLSIAEEEGGTSQVCAYKSTKENFRRWLTAPEGAASYDVLKIFKSLG